MGLKRNVPLATGLRYRGQGPMLTFVLHRIGGLGLAIFVGMHILASFLGGDIGSFLNNGLRITILDLWPKLLEYSREAIWVQWAVFLPIFGIAVFVIMSTALGG